MKIVPGKGWDHAQEVVQAVAEVDLGALEYSNSCRFASHAQ